jgi:hypothetical protein
MVSHFIFIKYRNSDLFFFAILGGESNMPGDHSGAKPSGRGPTIEEVD